MDDATGRYPVGTWVTATLATTAVGVAVRLGAALADVEVVVPDRGGDAVPLDLAPIVAVTVGAFVLAIVAVLVTDRLPYSRSRGVVRMAGWLLLAASFVPVYATGLPGESRLVLTVLHLLVGITVLRTVVRA